MHVDRNGLKWISGDGGPLVILQEGAAASWRGAANFDNSLMRGGNVETDYDVICRCADGINIINRHGRDMLVLSDSEWQACFVPVEAGKLAVIQWFGSDDTVEGLVQRFLAGPPAKTLHFTMVDTAVRLLVGAEDGDGRGYGFSVVTVKRGEKVCDVYCSDEAQLVVIRPSGP